MKRIILALALLFALGSTTKLAAQETRVRFYYYPSSNVYYNGEDVWKDNAMHMQKYKAKKNGTIKAKNPKSK